MALRLAASGVPMKCDGSCSRSAWMSMPGSRLFARNRPWCRGSGVVARGEFCSARHKGVALCSAVIIARTQSPQRVNGAKIRLNRNISVANPQQTSACQTPALLTTRLAPSRSQRLSHQLADVVRVGGD